MTRTLFTLVLMMVGCGQSGEGRSVVGQLPAEASGIFAIDTAGRQAAGSVDGDSFVVILPAGVGVVLFAETAAGPVPVQFASDASGNRWQSSLPDFTGEVDLGLLTVHTLLQRDGEADEYAEPEENPLDQIDSDDDGEPDLSDDDDDDDGEMDDDDDDGDGDGVDDSDEDLDSDDDGDPDLSDDDDDNDGVDDADDDDDGDSDDDGVPDADDEDDDNDGEDDADETETETD